MLKSTYRQREYFGVFQFIGKNMKRILFLIILTMFITLKVCAQQNRMLIEDVKEIWVYDYFESKGYTTAGIAHRFHDLEKDSNIIKFKLDSIFVESLKNILLHSARIRETFQEKTGQNLIFAQFVIKDGSIRNIINSIGVVDYFIDHKAYYFVDDSDKMYWRNNYYGRLMEMINLHSDSKTMSIE